jgi:hypothetical protein
VGLAGGWVTQSRGRWWGGAGAVRGWVACAIVDVVVRGASGANLEIRGGWFLRVFMG